MPNAGEGLKRLQYRIEEWDADFHEYLRSLESHYQKPVIVTGDLNVAHQEIDIYSPVGKDKTAGFTPQERHSISQLLSPSGGFRDTFRDLYPTKKQFTFWSMRQKKRASNEGWRLDYFLISNQNNKGL